MTMHDTHNTFKLSSAINPAQVSDNTAEVGNVISMVGFNSLEFAIAIGTLADADATFTVLIEDRNGVDAFAAVDDSFLLGTEADASFIFSDDDTVNKIGYQGNKDDVRMTITPAANAGAADFAVVAIQGHARTNPVA